MAKPSSLFKHLEFWSCFFFFLQTNINKSLFLLFNFHLLKQIYIYIYIYFSPGFKGNRFH